MEEQQPDSIFTNPDPNNMQDIDPITDIEIVDQGGQHQFDYVFKVITIGDPCKSYSLPNTLT